MPTWSPALATAGPNMVRRTGIYNQPGWKRWMNWASALVKIRLSDSREKKDTPVTAKKVRPSGPVWDENITWLGAQSELVIE
ncbi:hypothetical protein [Phaffia rhodozyma]|uniref:Uncharacterized protein n=1 Tax=Phaffia rhodozyma TaxID=264483 RepID=A0A0F7SUG8_PHARH|nr:hypothetical protein [Phaffia rhodozyma]